MKIKVHCCNSIVWWHKIGVWAIQSSEEMHFSHVAIESEGYIYEAVFPQSRKIEKAKWLEEFQIVESFEFDLSSIDFCIFMQICEQNLNKSYSLLQIVVIWISNWCGVLEHYIEKTIWDGNKALICSEYVADPLNLVLDYQFENSIDTIGMDEIYFCLNKIGKKVE